MIFDDTLIFSDGQAITTSALSDKIIDWGSQSNPGAGTPLYAYFVVGDAFAGPSGANVTFSLAEGQVADLSGPTRQNTSVKVPVANLGSGSRFALTLSPLVANNGTFRYMGVNYLVGSGPLTAGTITAAIVLAVPDATIYPAFT